MSASPYSILGVSASATDEEIKKAYRKLSLEHHPDRGGDAKQFQTITAAYEKVNDASKRAWYNQHGDKPRPQSPPIRIGLSVTLEELYNGATKTINEQISLPCSSCVCTICNGTGRLQQVVNNNNTHMIVQRTCHHCRGQAPAHCASCRGSRQMTVRLQRQVEIQKGCNIQQEELDSWSQDHRTFVVVAKPVPHPLYELRYPDLIMRVTVPLVDAICGFKKRIAHFDQSQLILQTDDILQTGDVYTIEQSGMPCDQGHGKLIVIIDKIIYPSSLTQDQKSNIRRAMNAKDVNNDEEKDNDKEMSDTTAIFQPRMVKQRNMDQMAAQTPDGHVQINGPDCRQM
jgi:DnaJ-class molecular chaperone